MLALSEDEEDALLALEGIELVIVVVGSISATEFQQHYHTSTH